MPPERDRIDSFRDKILSPRRQKVRQGKVVQDACTIVHLQQDSSYFAIVPPFSPTRLRRSTETVELIRAISLAFFGTAPGSLRYAECPFLVMNSRRR
ncbi:solute carrier family 2, facilitated glucose transporter member 5-like protein [Anopheles sinensis]|uniref:Solute carrier family 2, facilitated glucose transporter member 5-like protein n=1 Tax=Anopheles sinensis TaxID=74873 RepID=A0A084VES1_ANOSI|nr:solute carrier family 2, facilitated glucose transporter member 5-like protein [Anopheles sinensis]